MSKIALALVLILGLCNHALCTELWVIKDDDCVYCREFRDNIYSVYLEAQAQEHRLPVIVVMDVDRDRREIMVPHIHRYWRGTPSFLLIENDGKVRPIFPDIRSPMGFIADVIQAIE